MSKIMYSELRGKIIGVYGSLMNFASVANISYSKLYSKLRGITLINTIEVQEWCKLLNISDTEIAKYFFAPTV